MSKDLNKTNDELEEEGMLECCAHCGSIHITVEEGNLYCNNCGIVDYTEKISEEDWAARNNIKV